MKRLVCMIVMFGPVALMGQKKEDILAIQRDVANLQDQVKQLQKSQDERMAALQSMMQQTVDASNRVASGLTAMQRDVDQKLNDQQTKLVAPVATVGTKVDQMADDFRSVATNVAELVRRMSALDAKLSDISNAIRTLSAPPSAPRRMAVRGRAERSDHHAGAWRRWGFRRDQLQQCVSRLFLREERAGASGIRRVREEFPGNRRRAQRAVLHRLHLFQRRRQFSPTRPRRLRRCGDALAGKSGNRPTPCTIKPFRFRKTGSEPRR